ncbi:hypothetical protein KI387_032296, partial [Taxus chinensis]
MFPGATEIEKSPIEVIAFFGSIHRGVGSKETSPGATETEKSPIEDLNRLCPEVARKIARMFGHHHHHDQQQPAPSPAPHGGGPSPYPPAPYGGGPTPPPPAPYAGGPPPYLPAPLQGDVVKIYCEANPDYYLANINGNVAMAPANESDPNQQWIMDTSWGVKAKDEAGYPAFALINKVTGQALRHGRAENEKILLGPYHPDDLNDAVLFTQSADMGRGYQCIKPVNNIHVSLDARVEGDKHGGRLLERAEVVLSKWNKKKESQKWKISPILSLSQRGTSSEYGPLYPTLNEEPQGHPVRVYCEANPDFFLTAQGQLAVLTLGSPHDPYKQWIKVDSWGLKEKDSVGFPAFALVNKATKQALRHRDKAWDQIYLGDYNHMKLDKSFLWTLSGDVGNGYQCLRPVNNIRLNMDAKAADGAVGGIHEGNELILFQWNKQRNQKWKLQLLNSEVGAICTDSSHLQSSSESRDKRHVSGLHLNMSEEWLKMTRLRLNRSVWETWQNWTLIEDAYYNGFSSR